MATALIVDDHPDHAQLLARILRMRDFEPIIAEDGRTGLRLARRHIPDVLLLDLMLPDISGFEVCRQLRVDPATMLIPVVMLTALDDMQHRLHGFRVGANAYVTKPYGLNDLFEAISAARAWRASMIHRSIHGEFNVEINSEISLLKDLNDFLMRVCQTTPLSGDQVLQLRQAVMEMARNAIEWGNEHQSERPVKITYRIHEDHLEIVVRDQGPGFDRNYLPHAAMPDDPLSHLDVREKLGLRAGVSDSACAREWSMRCGTTIRVTRSRSLSGSTAWRFPEKSGVGIGCSGCRGPGADAGTASAMLAIDSVKERTFTRVQVSYLPGPLPLGCRSSSPF